MAYQKTAKDLAWDRERTRYNSEIQKWMRSYQDKVREVGKLTDQIELLKNENKELRTAIATLSAGNLTPEEAVDKMRKNAELCDLMKLMINGTRGMF